ncbi:MAG: SAM-dependent methyltransferase [Bacteroides stercoris]
MERIIEQTEDGSTTLFVPELNEHYHSVKGARTESQHIFIDMGLKASAATLPHILEIGFGTGLNALLTLETAGLEQRPVHYTGIELYPLSWEEVDVLHYSDNPLFKELHTAPWHKDVNITPYFTLHKIQGDVNKVMSDKQSAMSDRLPVHHSSLTTNHYFDLVYFDAFAPEKRRNVERRAFPAHTCPPPNAQRALLTTYCAKALSAEAFASHQIQGRASSRSAGVANAKYCGHQNKGTETTTQKTNKVTAPQSHAYKKPWIE